MSTNFPNGVSSFGIPMLGGGAIPFTGTYFFCDPANGNDGNSGKSPAKAVKTLYKAHSLCTSGKNDVVYLISDGATTGTARLSAALAATVDSTATTGTLTWSKSATHLIGICAPSSIGQRARIAPPSGTYTMATFGSGNFVVVSGAGCLFQNLSFSHGFSTGGASQICLTVSSASHNVFVNCNILGAVDAASAQATTSRSLVLSQAHNNLFKGCVIGNDTVARTVANTTVEFIGGAGGASGCARNIFEDCIFPVYATATTTLCLLGTAANAIDRFALFNKCIFINPPMTSSAQMAALLTYGGGGGTFIFKDCCLAGKITGFGTDATTRVYTVIEGGTPAAATTGLAVAPTA